MQSTLIVLVCDKTVSAFEFDEDAFKQLNNDLVRSPVTSLDLLDNTCPATRTTFLTYMCQRSPLKVEIFEGYVFNLVRWRAYLDKLGDVDEVLKLGLNALLISAGFSTKRQRDWPDQEKLTHLMVQIWKEDEMFVIAMPYTPEAAEQLTKDSKKYPTTLEVQPITLHHIGTLKSCISLCSAFLQVLLWDSPLDVKRWQEEMSVNDDLPLLLELNHIALYQMPKQRTNPRSYVENDPMFSLVGSMYEVSVLDYI